MMSVIADRRGNLWVGADSGVFMLRSVRIGFELRQRIIVPMEGGNVGEAPDAASGPTSFAEGLRGSRMPVAGRWPARTLDVGDGRILIDEGANAWISMDGGVARVPLSQRGGATAAQGLSRAQGLSGGSVFDLFEDREHNSVGRH